MKVVQVLPSLDGGGVERGTLEIAKGLVDAGHESIVISAGGRMVPQLEREGSRHRQWDLGRKSPLTFLHIRAVRRWLQREKPDILHLRSRLPAWICWLAWKGLPADQRPRLVTTVHGLYSVNRYSAIMCRGERVIAVSETVRDYVVNNYPQTDTETIRVIYRGVDPDEFPGGFRPSDDWLAGWYQCYPRLQGQRVLTLPGRLTRLKGHHDFIDLIKGLRASGFPVQGLIVGGEDPKRRAYAAEIRERIVRESLDECLVLTGARQDIREIFAVSDLVLSLSTKPESFGRTVVEALTLGVPVVGYDHGGVGEVLRQLYPQGRVPLGDAGALLAAVRNRLEQPQPRPRNDIFLLSDMVAQTLSCYRELVD
ncbi:glycosyltransferase involved in cell wall biosynthesis [Marinobacter nauticus]|uniref:Glycosyltransferase involved in cell wall biosynthesis n=1 Tax=Marinobacter nauticus TaxID=2743 RepID=A0A368XF12_MARNT|nr:glycosyltransferase family 4 protein [Marinobacter nauticus]RCW66543.1 glycosyltransferase involved in cell wall biosynthesis [Marinobacter nauticus]